MIPYLPEGTSDLELPKFYDSIVSNLEIRSGHHEAWHTHKRDTSVCWICDLVEVSKLLVREIERYISKSALDIDDSFIAQELNSEDDTVINAETSDNSDGISGDRYSSGDSLEDSD